MTSSYRAQKFCGTSSDLTILPCSAQLNVSSVTVVVFWAGTVRPCSLFKGGSEFCRPRYIEDEAERILGALRHPDNFLRGLPEDDFVRKAAELLGDLNALHPFREGNGRSLRAFFGEIADNAGYPVNVWPGDEVRNIKAFTAAHNGNNGLLEQIIVEAVRLSMAVESS